MRHFCQCGFDFRQTVCFQQLIWHASVFEHGDVAGSVLILLSGTEKLQGSALAPLVLDTGRGAQRFQAITAVFRQSHHASFIFHVVAGVAVAQHLPHPFQLELGSVKTDGQRSVALKHPLNCF